MDGKQTPSEEPTWQFKPGETISPRSESPAQPIAPAAAVPQQPVATPTPVAAAPNPEAQVAAPVTVPPTTYDNPTEATEPQESYDASGEGLSWSASEFISHDKTARWHLGLVGVAVLVAAVLWLITKDIVTSVVVIFAGVVLSLYGARRPSQLQYQLDNYGIGIGQKHFNFSDFRAFSIVPEGAFASIALLPTKRFAPMTTLYFAPEDGDAILEILGNHLPQQPTKADPIDSLMRKIRF